MCGIFGIIVKSNSAVSKYFIRNTFESIAKISIARGKDSSGVVFKTDTSAKMDLVKGDIPVNKLIKSAEYKNSMQSALHAYSSGSAFQAIGHARLVTNGSQLRDVNNQPVTKDGIVGIHNGIIVNNEELWMKHPDLKRDYEIDTEILFSIIKKGNKNSSLPQAINNALNQVEGTASCALLFDDRNELALFTNNGSLYYVLEKDYLVFASEEHFLRTIFKEHVKTVVLHLKSRTGVLLNINTFDLLEFLQDENFSEKYDVAGHQINGIKITNLKGDFNSEVVIDPEKFIDRKKETDLYGLLENNAESIGHLLRCTRCILPETFPFITFDAEGICNYCNNYRPQNQINDFSALKALVQKYKRTDGRPDCIVPFSGGRDSTYSLHIIKKELGLNPIAFTYDWGMVTDLARRNIARVCGKLGVENIVVSADIKWKRENIKKNIRAWLKNPELGMIPLFMAGDKYFFYYCNQLKKQTGIDLNIWGINNLENTDFKTGFAGLAPQFDKKRIYSLKLRSQLKLFGYVAENLFKSPGYVNQSVFDSLGSFAVRYLSPKKDYFHLFDYYKWDEQELEQLIASEYNWEKSIDTNSTWRIGDGTASFYNYIYYTVAGFTENDTFRSNQIREGMITREYALAKVIEENTVRYETLRWYLEIIGLDFKEVINVVNDIPKLYRIL